MTSSNPGHIPKAPSNVIALEAGASIYKFWEDTLSPLQTHYLYQPVEEKLYIAEAKASKFLNGLQFPSLSITPPILPLLPLLLLLFLLSRPPPPSLTITTYEPSSEGKTSAEANPQEADSFRLCPDFIPYNWAARPSWERGWSSSSLLHHRKKSTIKGF